jgi:hypothetical protein
MVTSVPVDSMLVKLAMPAIVVRVRSPLADRVVVACGSGSRVLNHFLSLKIEDTQPES